MYEIGQLVYVLKDYYFAIKVGVISEVDQRDSSNILYSIKTISGETLLEVKPNYIYSTLVSVVGVIMENLENYKKDLKEDNPRESMLVGDVLEHYKSIFTLYLNKAIKDLDEKEFEENYK